VDLKIDGDLNFYKTSSFILEDLSISECMHLSSNEIDLKMKAYGEFDYRRYHIILQTVGN
jgi:hypothetical protein